VGACLALLLAFLKVLATEPSGATPASIHKVQVRATVQDLAARAQVCRGTRHGKAAERETGSSRGT
jgi:hypothetical protein